MSRWAPGAEVDVWVTGWEWQCCGDDLRVGRQATLPVAREEPPEVFDARGLLASPLLVDGWERHHEDGPQPPAVTGTVTRVRRLDGRYVPEHPGSRTLVPDLGSGRLTELTVTDHADDAGDAGDGPSGPVGFLVTLRLL